MAKALPETRARDPADVGGVWPPAEGQCRLFL